MIDISNDTPELADHYDRISNAQFKLGLSLIKKMDIKEGDVILDVGCGTGRLALSVVKMVGPSGKVTGLDPSSNRILVANQKMTNHSYPNLQFMVGKAEDMSAFSEDSFDGVYFSSVFHWIGEKEKALGEANRVLKTGGRIGITMPSPDGFSIILRKIISDVLSRSPYVELVKRTPGPSHLITKEELETLLLQAGFTDIIVEIDERKRFHQSASDLIDFYDTSTFGNYLRFVPENLRESLKNEIIQELEKRRTVNGIDLVSKTIFAIAKKSI